MTSLGYPSLTISLVLAAYATIVYFLAARYSSRPLLLSAHRAVRAAFILVSLSCALLFYALFTRNFQIQYVAEYSNRSLSWFYTAAAFWAGQAGSLLLWAWLLTLFAFIVIVQNKKNDSPLISNAMTVISLTTFFFLYLIVFKSNPFEKTPTMPQDGNGLNPLLQNPEMIFHPPSLYIGFVGFTVPFAFAMAALITKKLDSQWTRSIRRWTLFSWLFLTIGNILGMQWAYVELGWGGYWAWDPVENSSLLPWLTGTAFLHTSIVQERRGMLKAWNMSLVALTFALTIFGTFVTRSGLISSVHAFGVSSMGPLFIGFLTLILSFAFTFILLRAGLLASNQKIETWTSKESSFMLNNILFMALTVGVFLGTIMPAVTELFIGKKMSVGIEFFNRMAIPICIAIFLLIGFCTVLKWDKTTLKDVLNRLWIPATATLIVMLALALKGPAQPIAFVALAAVFMGLLVTIFDIIKNLKSHRQSQHLNVVKALFSMIIKSKRRYGGYIVHIGVLLFGLGIIGSSAFSIEKTATLRVGETLKVGSYELFYQGLRSDHKNDIHIDVAHFNILKNGTQVGTIRAEKHLHPNFQPATEVGIRTTLKEDLYLILADYDVPSQLVTISALVNPLIAWMWIGACIMILGALIAILPAAQSPKKDVNA